METFARFGYAAKGFVYAAIGILALMAAFNIYGGKMTGASGALKEIAQQPFGKILLLFIAINLIGYAVWKLIQAFKDPRNQRSGFSGLLNRLSCIITAVAYSGIAVESGLLTLNFQSGGNSKKSEDDWAALIMQQSWGRWLVGLVGAIIIGFGMWQIRLAYKIKFRQNINLKKFSSGQKKWLLNISRYGIAVRGLVFAAFGFFILEAAHQYNPEKVRGLDGVLFTFVQQPFGKLLLALAATGIIAYAVYLFILAFFRRIKTS